jgi:hypothetical protein
MGRERIGYAISLAAVNLAVISLAGPVKADIPGVYARTQTVDNGAIRYTLTLKPNGDAELRSERQRRPYTAPDNLKDYGKILLELDKHGAVTHLGSWRARGRSNHEFSLSLNRMEYGRDNRDEPMKVNGSEDRDGVRLEGWNRSLYGNKTDFRLNRSKSFHDIVSNGTHGLINPTDRDRNRDNRDRRRRGPEELDAYGTGRGTYIAGTNGPQDIKSVHATLLVEGRIKIELNLNGQTIPLEGQWTRSSSRSYKIDVFRVEEGSQGKRVAGTGTLTLNGSRSVGALDLKFTKAGDETKYSVTFTGRR